MHPLQIAALAALGVGVIIYVWVGIKRQTRAEKEFFFSLVSQMSQLLEPRGFHLTKQVYLPKSFGHRMARFESSGFLVDVVLDGKEHDVRLIRRRRDKQNLSAEDVLGESYLGLAPTPSDYGRAATVILDAAASIHGAA